VRALVDDVVLRGWLPFGPPVLCRGARGVCGAVPGALERVTVGASYGVASVFFAEGATCTAVEVCGARLAVERLRVVVVG
jgi:hypothetical protein